MVVVDVDVVAVVGGVDGGPAVVDMVAEAVVVVSAVVGGLVADVDRSGRSVELDRRRVASVLVASESPSSSTTTKPDDRFCATVSEVVGPSTSSSVVSVKLASGSTCSAPRWSKRNKPIRVAAAIMATATTECRC